MEKFDPKSIKKFRFVSWDFDEVKSMASFHYAFDDTYTFTEEMDFHVPGLALSSERREALNKCLEHLFLVVGISYYKAALPPEIVIENFEISEETALFMEGLYLNGLGDFAYKNKLDLRGKIKFPFSSTHKPSPSDLPLRQQTAVPLGGGKDSVATLEVMRSAKEPIVLFAFGDFSPIKEVAKISGLPFITVSRRISPALLELNSQGALNGHIPISSIIAFVLTAAAVLYDFDVAVLSNERSANVGNVVVDGFSINHQYDKSFDFEKKISLYLKTHVLSQFSYFSFLRPLSELSITRLFSKDTPYHHSFTSCNAVFRIKDDMKGRLWCLNCPKCLSTFLLLAPFIDKESLLSVFKENLLNDEKHMDGYAEMLGLKGHKPFECVAEPEEYMAAFFLLLLKPEWKDDLLVKHFAGSIPSEFSDPKYLDNTVFRFSEEHLLPARFEKILREALRT